MSSRAPNVQEIVRGDPFKIPREFLAVRNEDDVPPSADVSHDLSSEIPIIDFSLLYKGHKDELNKLDQACKEWGFFQVVNHGVATQVLQEMKDHAAKFFDLPFEEKNKICMSFDENQGYGQIYPASEGQTLDWCDALFLTVYPSHSRNPKFWPTTPKGFKEAIETYSSELKRIGEAILGSLSQIMGMENNALLGFHREMNQVLRVTYYPPCSMPDKVIGLSPHSDTSTITILMQDDNVTGLQIRKEGEWVPVKPIPDALVVNIGDMLEIWSHGKYKSVEHRAVINESKARLSYATFLYPHFDVDVEPFAHLVESSQLYKKVKYGEYLMSSLKGKLEGKSHTTTAKTGS